MSARSWNSGADPNGFNGKRKDDEMYGQGNEYDYGMRMYDPRLGRPLSIDPKFRQFASLSTYQYFSNNPILFVDMDGQEGVQYLETTKYSDGTTVTQRIVELDVYVAVNEKAENGNYKPADVEAIKKDLNAEFNTGNFTDDQCNKVVFKFNVKTFNTDEVSADEKGAQLRRDDSNIKYGNVSGTNGYGETMGVQASYPLVLEQSDALESDVQGKTEGAKSTISSKAFNASHTKAHEITHFFLFYDPNNPPGDNKGAHNAYGGILHYADPPKEGEKAPTGQEGLNQTNVDQILKYVPQAKPVTKEANTPANKEETPRAKED
jgi:RHS repeat-associated protein